MVEAGDIGEEHHGGTAAGAASLTATLAAAAARAADLAEKVAHVGATVAREFALPAICNVVLDEAIRTLGAQLAAIHLADEAEQPLRLLGQRGIPEDLLQSLSQIPLDAWVPAARAVSSRRVQIVTGVDRLEPSALFARELLQRTDCNTMVALPLVAHERIVGVLTLALDREHPFAKGERATLDSCTHVFSFAIAHAILYEDARRLCALFEAVGRASVAIASELELEPSLQNIVDEARRIADAEYAALGIVVSPERPFDPWVFSGATREAAARIGRVPRPIGTLGVVTAMDCPLRVPDARQHPAFQGLPPHHPAISSFLGVPIRFDGRSLGNLYLANKRSADGFSVEDEKAIELLAAHAGAVVHQRRLRQQLDAERARFEAIFESAPHGVVFMEPTTGTVRANSRATELVGEIFAPGGGHGGELLTPDGKTIPEEERPFQRALRGETVKPQEFLFRHPDGRELPVLVSAAPVREPAPQGTVLLFEDISTLKRLQRLREEWSSIVLHELRQPLTVLDASIGLIGITPKLDDELLERATARARRAAKSLTRLVNDMADASGIEARRLELKRQRVQLDVIARTVVEEEQARSSERLITLLVHDPIPPVDADPVRIEQVLSNLMANASKYAAPATPVNVEVHVEEGEVRVVITNQGPGLAPEELPRLFDRFYRTAGARAGSVRGLGLGLYVSKGIIDAHGGRIWAESLPDGPTTFRFALSACEVSRPV